MNPNWHSGPIPLELGLALLESPAALEKYAALPRRHKKEFIRNAPPSADSAIMQAYVQRFLEFGNS